MESDTGVGSSLRVGFNTKYKRSLESGLEKSENANKVSAWACMGWIL